MNNRPLASNSDIHKFAAFWLDIFQNSTDERDTFSMQNQMIELGFDMDSGKAFESAYGLRALHYYDELQHVIDRITDIQILCSGIHSAYRRITYWANEDLLDSENREWFIAALSRLLQLTSYNHVQNNRHSFLIPEINP